MSLGTPIGSARMAGATSEAPPDPPAEITPTMSAWRRSQLAKASAIAVTEAPRSEPNTALPPRGWLSAISWAETSQDESLPLVETSTSRVRNPLPATMSRMNLSSSPLVSSVPATRTVGGPELRAANASRRGGAASWQSQHAARKRPRAGLDACDRYRLRPSGRRRRIGNIDASRRQAGEAAGRPGVLSTSSFASAPISGSASA